MQSSGFSMGWFEVLVDPEKGVNGLVQIPPCRFLVQSSLQQNSQVTNDARMLGTCTYGTRDPRWSDHAHAAVCDEDNEHFYVVICDSIDHQDTATYLGEEVIPSLREEHPTIEVWHYSFLSLWRQILWETTWPDIREYECSLLDAIQRRLPAHDIPAFNVWKRQTRARLLDSFHSKLAQAFIGHIEEQNGHDILTEADTESRLRIAADVIMPIAEKLLGD